MSTIELREIAKSYGQVKAVDAVSCTIREGEFMTILGPSGSGKTTMLSLIAGLIAPSGGQILIGGRDVTEMPAAQRNIGLVFQSYALFPNMTVEGNVAFPLEVRRVPRGQIRELVAEVLKLVHLGGLEERRPSQLSGGQQQRVALARALVFKPGILLLDEPLAALDRKLRDEVRLELRRIQRTLGVTTLLVTHDQDEALSLSDRLLVLDQGEVQQIGTPDELYLRPANRFVADFLGTANLLQDGKACALVRPERIVLHPESAAQGLPAAVTESVYHGQSVRYHLRLDDGSELVAVAADRVPRFAAGARVRAAWSPEDVWVIPEGEDTAAARASRRREEEE